MYSPLTDRQWQRVGKNFAAEKPRPRRKADRRGGRPRLSDRACFDAMIWSLFHGRAEDLPRELGSARTLRRRVAEWRREGRLVWAWYSYLATLPDQRRRELAAALARNREELDWRSHLRYLLERQYGERMAAAAAPPLTDKALDPELEKLFEQFRPPSWP